MFKLIALGFAVVGVPVITAGLHATTAAAQSPQQPATVNVEHVQVHSQALEGNLEGNSPDRDVWVALPPGYKSNPSRRYPVVYALHGFTGTPDGWIRGDKLEQRISNAFGNGVREFILVFPNAYTLHGGSMYSKSDTIGDWEAFITRDLVTYIDRNYRSIPERGSRGLMGHSMGGYGTVRLGLKYPDVFSSFYSMSACCLSARDITPEMGRTIEGVKTKEQAVAGNFMVRATLAVAAAWSPNPKNPPFFVDLPTRDGVVQKDVLAKWAANAPIALVPQYASNLRRYNAITIDVGDRDGLLGDNMKLHEALDGFSIPHVFEVYDGDHGSGVASRFEQKVLPFFSKHLQF
jgi:S-formylglutathione hydrolase FrmB